LTKKTKKKVNNFKMQGNDLKICNLSSVSKHARCKNV